jgi:hypothetical protein
MNKLVAFSAAFALLLSGCGLFSPKGKEKVTGTVTVNDEPLPQGKIVFIDLDRSVPQDGGDIADGKFEILVSPGKKKIQILASREIPGAKFDPSMGGVPRHQYIPARYNNETTLEEEIKPAGLNELTFRLTEP